MTSPIAYRLLPIASQRGAMFGLDARIALAIFGIIAVIAGMAVVVNRDTTNAKALATELTETGQAIEVMHTDIKEDVFEALLVPSAKNAFQALFDNDVLTENDNIRAHWNGPYIKFTSTLNPKYGDMTIEKHAGDHTQPCVQTSTCYLFITYSSVKPSIIAEVNLALDGDEQNPSTDGRVQWTNDQKDTSKLYFRAARALSLTAGDQFQDN